MAAEILGVSLPISFSKSRVRCSTSLRFLAIVERQGGDEENHRLLWSVDRTGDKERFLGFVSTRWRITLGRDQGRDGVFDDW